MLYSLMFLLLSSCSTIIKDTNTSTNAQPLDDKPATLITVPDKTFDEDTFYSLLAAEMALDRRRIDIAKSHYVQQAEKTQDLAVIARAAKIASVVDDPAGAVILTEQWTKTDPNNLEARFIYLNALINNQQYLQAFEESFKLAKAGEESAFYDIAVKASAEESFQLNSLSNRYASALETLPKNEELLTGHSILMLNKGEFDSAMSSVDQAIQINPDEIRHTYQKSRILQATGNEQDALDMFADMVKRYPENRQLRLRYASLLVLKDLDAAEAQYQELHNLEADDHDALLALALVQQRNENSSKANISFKKLILMGQHVPEAYYGLGELAESNGLYTEALENYAQVTEGTRRLRAINASAKIIAKEQDLSAANQYLNNQSLELNTNEKLQIILTKAELFHDSGDYKKTEQIYTQGIEASPNNSTLLYARALLYADTNQMAKAEQDLLKVIELKPESPAALNALGYSLADKTTRYTEARDYIRRAYAINSTDPAILDSMGWVEYKLGNLLEAKKYLEKAMSLVVDDEIASHLGEVLWKLGETNQAKKIWNKGLELVPDSEHILETLERLGVSLSHKS